MVTMELTGGMGVISGGRSKVKSMENVSEDSGLLSSVMMISTQDSVSPGLITSESVLLMKSSFSAGRGEIEKVATEWVGSSNQR